MDQPVVGVNISLESEYGCADNRHIGVAERSRHQRHAASGGSCQGGAKSPVTEGEFPGFPASSSGSSPQAWGTQPVGEYGQQIIRFIPTGVGNTMARSTIRRAMSVHPHRRGEHHHIESQGIPDPRFIPTGVGNTNFCYLFLGIISVHPHRRGEHSKSYVIYRYYNGSSPQAWGTRNRQRQDWPAERFIPTGVGNT